MNALHQPLRSLTAPAHFAIGACKVDLDTHRVLREGVEQRLAAKSVAVLTCLIEHAGSVVSRERLLSEVWNSAVASDELLTQAIRELRRAFRDDPRAPQYIETIPKAGYRLIATLCALPVDTTLAALPELPPASNEAHPPPTRDRGARWLVAAALALACVAIGALLLNDRGPRQETPSTSPPTSLTSGYGGVEFPSLSPDGALVAYAARLPEENDTRIYVQTSAGSQPLALTAPKGASDSYPVWSPDGKSIAFLRIGAHECTMHLVAATGGTPRALHPCFGNSLQYFDWTPDGKALITEGMRNGDRHLRLQLIGIDDGAERPLDYPIDPANDDLVPHYSPDGKSIAFRRGQNPYSDLYTMQADGTALRRITTVHAAITGFSWLPDGQGMVFSSNYEDKPRLYLLDLRSGAVRRTDLVDSLFPAMARGANRLVAVRDRTTMNLAEYRIDSDADAAARAPSGGVDVWPAYARDGALCFVSDRSGSWQLWLSRTANEEPQMMTQLDRSELPSHPVWSTDGARILFVAQHGARSRLLSLDVASQQLREIEGVGNVRTARFAPDGHSLDLASDRSGDWQLWRYAPDSGAFRRLVDAPVIAFDYGPNGTIYYTQANMPGLRRSVGGASDSVSSEIHAANRIAWQAAADGIVFIEQIDAQHANLRLLKWDERESTLLRTVSGLGADLAIALDAEGKRLALPSMSHLSNAVIVSEIAR